MFCGFVGLIAMSTSLSPLSAGPSFEMFVVVRTRGPPWAAAAPTANASAAFGEHGLDRVGRGVLLVPETPRVDVLEEKRNGFHRVLLVRPDDSRRSALDPAGAVDPGGKLVVVMDDATALVADRAASLVE